MADRISLKSVLKKDGTWKGMFMNYLKEHPVSGEKGIVQKGKWIMDIEVEDDGIKMINKFFDEEGNQSNYEGSMKIKFEGDKVKQIGNTEVDPNTGNKIKDYDFEGYITEDHMFIKEEYVEVEEDKDVHRRNSLHYHLIDREEIMHTSDVYIDGELLVFGGNMFKKES
ncbi:MAG: hypothetical protein ACOC5D_04275 [Thermoplasmatota archaeon]